MRFNVLYYLLRKANTQRHSVTVTLRTLTPSFKVRILMPLPKRNRHLHGVCFSFSKKLMIRNETSLVTTEWNEKREEQSGGLFRC